MAEYIERKAAIDYIKQSQCKKCSDIGLCGNRAVLTGVRLFEEVPTADVAPVVHGRWECVYDDSTGETDVTCSHCKNTRTVNGCFVLTDGKSCYFEDDYCPNCGARMDGGESDNG